MMGSGPPDGGRDRSHHGERGRRRRRQALAWALLAVVVATTFAFGATAGGGPRTDAERVSALSKEIACPVCQGESVAQSNAPAALNIRREIARSVDAGRSDAEIRAFLARQYGEEQLLRPPGEGLSSLVWIVPVVAVVLAGAGLALVFRRWSAEDGPAPTDEDRELVARFLAADDVGEDAVGDEGAVPPAAGVTRGPAR